jgi:hypothetical protein
MVTSICDAEFMFATIGVEADERTMRRQILAFLEEYCRGMTLQDVREWYVDAFSEHMPTAAYAEGMLP